MRHPRGHGPPAPTSRATIVPKEPIMSRSTKVCEVLPAAILAAAILASACGSGSDDPCGGVTCSSRGFCIAESGTAYCSCIAGYHPVFLACEPNDPADPCLDVTCSGHGRCENLTGRPVCTCDPGFHNPAGYELTCAPDLLDGGGDVPPCSPGALESCNGLDDDCDGLTDEDFDLDLDPANCRLCGRACSGGPNARPDCVLGECGVTCEPGWTDRDGDPANGCEMICSPVSAPDETACDGRDDDCDGLTDEDASSTERCGSGFCERSAICHDGGFVCRPRLPPAWTDETCDDIDDDCDGLTDEDCSGYECWTAADCVPYEDADLCNGTLVCEGHLCVVDPATLVSCSREGETECRRNLCDPATGTCGMEESADGTPCNDGLWCTLTDECRGGACAGSGVRCPLSCYVCDETLASCRLEDGWCLVAGSCQAEGINPANPCESCQPAADLYGWTNAVAGTSCDDGSFCNGSETCNGTGSCLSGSNPCPIGGCVAACDDGGDRCVPASSTAVCRPAGDPICDPVAELCTGTSTTCPTNAIAPDGTSCSDGIGCTSPDQCWGGVCTAQETCDLVDNDCDGSTDEGVSCTSYDGDPVCPGSIGPTSSGCPVDQCRNCSCSSSLTWVSCGSCAVCPV